MKKNITILLITILSLLSSQQSYANIAEGEVGTCVWYITDEGELVIAPVDSIGGDLPEEGWTYQIDEESDYTTAPWGEYRGSIFSAKIMSGVNATSCRYMLSGLNNMKNVDLSNFNTQNVTDMRSMFEGCSSLTSLDLSNFNTENVTGMGSMFAGCSSLTSLDLSNFNTQNMMNMSHMFAGCSSLTSLDLSNFNTQNVRNMGYMFSDCSSITSLDLSNFNTQNVTDMGWMFDSCSSLTSLDLSNFNTENVTDMEYMFSYCSSLTTLDLSNFNTQNVTSMGYMFYGCSSLTTIISNRETPSTLKVGTFESFDNRENCTLVVPEGTKELYANADGWNELGKIDDGTINSMIPEDAIASGETGTCIWYITSENELVIAPADSIGGDLPEGGWEFYYIENEEEWNIFYTTPWSEYSQDILTAKIMPGVNATSCSYMFAGLNKIGSVDLSGLNTENVTSMRNMFHSCSSLTSLNLSNFNTQNVTEMSGMFYDCSSLTSLDLSNFNTEKVTHMSWMFRRCSSLTSLDLSNFNTENVVDMSGMFSGCSSLTSLDLINFNTQNVTNMWNMFHSCSSLTSLNLSNFNTENVTNMDGMFDGCSSLTTIISNCEIPSPLKVGTFESFENRADCTLLVPEGTKELYRAADGWNELGKIDDGSYEFPDNTIAQGEVGTCIWYITSDNELVIAPADGVSGDLPEEGWEGYWNDEIGGDITNAPWGEYYESIFSAKVLPGVNAKSCKSMFCGLIKMTSINLSSFNTQEVTDMSEMFGWCSSLTSLDVSNFNTQNVTSMKSMFAVCSSLTSLDVSSFNTQNVTDMYQMFHSCHSLTSLDVNNFNTENVEDMWGMFGSCSALTFIDLSSLNTQSVGWMTAMFSDCSSLTSLDLSNFNMERVWDVRWMFDGCSSLNTIISNRDTPSTLQVGTFESFDNRANCTLLVPAGTKALYRAADGWNELGTIDDGTPDYPDAHGTLVLNLTSDEPFYNSRDYTADVVTYTRNFSKQTQKETSAGWETIVLPFDVINVITEDGKMLAPFGSTLAQTGSALPFWLAELKDGQYVAATSIRANTPYIISMPNGDDIYSKNRILGNVIFFAQNATVYASGKAQSVQGADGFAFVPTYDFVEASDSVYAINDEVFSDGVVDYQPGSVFARNSRTVRPFEAYMQHDASSAFAPRFIPVMPDETDAIITVTTGADKVSIYDLSGRKIDTMRKGVNIVVKDGKAVKIKSPL